MSESFREQLKMLVEGVRQLCAQGCGKCPLDQDPGCGAMLHWSTFDADAVIASVPDCAQLQTNDTFKAELAALAKDAHEMCIRVIYEPCPKCGLHTDRGCGCALSNRDIDIDTLLDAIAGWRKQLNVTVENYEFSGGPQE